MPLFSIITPTYNRINLLSNMIVSVKNQTFTDWELIIVDDGSTDNTSEIVEQFLADDRIKYIKKNNSGAADSRNVGAGSASGSFLVFLDSDDEVSIKWLGTVVSNLKADTGIVCVAAQRRFSSGKILQEPLFGTKIFGKKYKLKFTAGSLFVRRELFHQAGCYDAQLASNHHTDLGFRLMNTLINSNYKIVDLNVPLVQINVHESARIRTNWNKVREGSIMFLEKHYEFMLRNDKKGVSNLYAVIAFSNYKLNDRKECFKYIVKAIRWNPVSYKNYIRLFKYIF
ncbi:glycosyltransferase family 2 protein [Pontibacter virosus]|uniref:Glycosyltransferase involved in cell wall biosynthesis n=1 Tax=Pontibacter virosus TaxID=1765052 RepID=A0A2U1B300_9BACT|nr:glycosyltransferase family A protein [Pontibacter virosus]PVY43028.1 glycosyltransferase involved in cell wall biosynthesis [Pontibacter virosus]